LCWDSILEVTIGLRVLRFTRDSWNTRNRRMEALRSFETSGISDAACILEKWNPLLRANHCLSSI